MESADERTGARRFVILRHEGSAGYKAGAHWDFMFETGASLRTWALAELPTPDRAVEAERLADHRLAYLDYEGPISGDRGSVHRWDQGRFEVVSESEEEWIVALAGRELRGRLVFRHQIAGRPHWQCGFEPEA